MKQIIKLTSINPQEWTTFLTFNIERKPNTLREVSVDSTKITAFITCQPKESSNNFLRDYPTFTHMRLVGGTSIDVVETPQQIERLINNR